jgi:hypothetical protein
LRELLHRQDPTASIHIAPFNTKISCLATYSLWLENRRIRIWNALPETYNIRGYSEGDVEPKYFDVSWQGARQQLQEIEIELSSDEITKRTSCSGESRDSRLPRSVKNLAKLREDYRELVEKAIPANAKEIAIERSYGDLLQNKPYKRARRIQKQLLQRKAALEHILVRATQGSDASGSSRDGSLDSRITITDLQKTQS